jgi:cobalt-zinc-cadmium efflux system outer membrane protein
MRVDSRPLFVCAVVCLQGTLALAQKTLTLPEVLARVRERAPQIMSARMRIDEARGRLKAASLRFQANPDLELSAGRRRGPESQNTDFEIGLDQAMEPGSRRSARIEGVNAAIAESSANAEEVNRAILRDAANAFCRVVYENERIKLLDLAHDFAVGVQAAADRRLRSGDIAVLDFNIARASLGRAKAEREGARAVRATALGELKQMLQLDEEIDVAGSLDVEPPGDIGQAVELAARRPELRALEAGIAEAQAEVRLGESFRSPDIGLGVRYAHEEGDRILSGGVTVSLPVFSRGQEQRVVGSARASRLRLELEAARLRVRIEVKTAYETYERRLAAVRILDEEARTGMDENERLTLRSYDEGQIGLPDLLLIRREILDTRFERLDALLAAALARTGLDASTGALR